MPVFLPCHVFKKNFFLLTADQDYSTNMTGLWTLYSCWSATFIQLVKKKKAPLYTMQMQNITYYYEITNGQSLENGDNARETPTNSMCVTTYMANNSEVQLFTILTFQVHNFCVVAAIYATEFPALLHKTKTSRFECWLK